MTTLDLATPAGVTVALLPEIVLCAAAVLVLLVISWRHETAADSRLAGWLSLIGVLLSGAAQAWLWSSHMAPAGLAQMVALDTFRFAGNAIILVSAGVSILLSMAYMEREGMLAPEYYALVLMATSGMMFLAGAEDLIVVFLGLEVMSIAVYVLAGFNRRSIFAAEAALKYFLIGAFASGFLLYGIALVYGATGNTNLQLIGAQLAGGPMPLMARLGLALLLIGFAFKIAAVPFHMWAPDVYDGSPTPVAGLMATGVKAAGFLALTRVLMEAFSSAASLWQPVLGVLAVMTMIVGNLIALSQRSIKRMLAYSSVAHAGYLLVALWSGTRLGAGSVLLYLLAYGLTTLAAFGILASLGHGGERDVTNEDIAGLGTTRPWAAMGLTICMLSLLGFPGTMGFIGKWYILQAAVAQRQFILPVVLVLTSVISAGYYLPVIMTMYMKPARVETDEAGMRRLGRPAAFAVAFTVLAVVLLGIWPAPIFDSAVDSAASLTERAAPLARQ
ncbi:MAG: NADH-quinone oxidoreductase subunit N [Gemmatimonadales bacterium]|nr:NADH-quinone oxidoreductase subunit N [Gemmatimonadales bacterium]